TGNLDIYQTYQSTQEFNHFKPNPCFSTSFYLHHRRWMCILQHSQPNTTPFLIFFIRVGIF
ncbi:hypothetical protein, partial [Acinetobacter colistiniresistens]|uniref:hypothetical protein n=1 Tax=Acinetobacter colistiniresistens TaxID=280145 RepID=UPI001C06C052